MKLLKSIEAVSPDRPVLVAIDGFDGAGKTVLAHELAELASTVGKRRVLNVSIDDFHHPRAHRRAAGAGPESFYCASYDYQAFQDCVVAPLRAGRPVVPAVWDVDADKPIAAAPVEVKSRVVV
ncbi:nucleoside/nucleotide kinase family protein [Dermacoccus nishinomiyaensis]